MIIKNKKDEALLKEGGAHLAEVLARVLEATRAGVSTLELDTLAEKLIRASGGRPSFKNYKTPGTTKSYPASLCVSINSEVVHGIPAAGRHIQEGDLVGLDIGMEYKGFFTDMALTKIVGTARNSDEKALVETACEALSVGIGKARVGGFVGDIGEAIEKFVKSKSKNFSIVRELVGHGVGAAVHEDPEVPNWGTRGTGVRLEKGMVLALEPMLTLGSSELVVSRDGWVWSTKSGKVAAHFEHTILVTKNGPEIITKN